MGCRRHESNCAWPARFNPLLLLLLAAGCGPRAPHPVDAPDENRDERAAYRLFFAGRPVGIATERMRADDDGFQLTRRERIRVARDGADVESETTIRISGPRIDVPNRIEWQTTAGARSRAGRAERQAGGWRVNTDGTEPAWIAGDALPWELLPWLPSPPRGTVILPGLGFAVSELSATQSGSELELTLMTERGPLRTHVQLDGRRWQTVVSGAVRAERTNEEPAMPPRVPDIITESAIAVAGPRTFALELAPMARPAPPAFAGQTVQADGRRWLVEFTEPARPGETLAPILASEVNALRHRMALSTQAPQDFTGSAGDCTAFASALIERLRARGLSAVAVTGFRIDDGKLFRHRWVEVKGDAGWVAVDPTVGLIELPRGRYLALARHGATFSDVTLADEVTFADTGRARASYR